MDPLYTNNRTIGITESSNNIQAIANNARNKCQPLKHSTDPSMYHLYNNNTIIMTNNNNDQ